MVPYAPGPALLSLSMPLRCRMGASAILLSNKRSWVRSGKAKYVLTKALRVHLGARDDAYK